MAFRLSGQTSIAEVILLVCTLTHECIFRTGYSESERPASFQNSPTGHYRYCSHIFFCLWLSTVVLKDSQGHRSLEIYLLRAGKGNIVFHNSDIITLCPEPVYAHGRKRQGAWLGLFTNSHWIEQAPSVTTSDCAVTWEIPPRLASDFTNQLTALRQKPPTVM